MRTNGKITRRTYWICAVFSLIILTPNILAIIMATDVTGPRAHLIYIVCSLCWFVMPAAFFKIRGFFAFHSITILLGLVECVHLIINKATTSLLFVYTIIIAEPGEAFELFFSAWPLILLAAILWTAYLTVCFKCLPNVHLLPLRTRYLSAVVSVSVIILIIADKPTMPENYEGDKPVQQRSVKREISREVKQVFPYNLMAKTYDIVRLKGKIEAYPEEADGEEWHATYGEKSKTPVDVVLVMGETARYGNFSINGYERETTPYLSAQRNLISFDSIYSVANLTTVSVPLILNEATPENAREMSPERNLIEVFNAAGFHTSWIANQSFGNQILMNISGRCAYTKYMQAYNDEELGEMGEGEGRAARVVNGCYDMEMMNYIMPAISESEHERKFMFIHTLGSHFKYNCRYPEEFSVYRPDVASDADILSALDSIRAMVQRREIRTDHPLISSVRKLLVNSYDNTIVYTDYFLHTLIEHLDRQERPTVMMYVSDHGENLLDDERMLFLHATYAGSIYEYHVPMFIWYSDEYEELYPERVEQLKANRGCKTSTMTVFNTLTDLAGIEYSGIDSTLCLSSPRLENREKIAGIDANLNVIDLPER